MSEREKQPVIWQGKTYESYRQAARELGVSVETVRQRHLRGQQSTDDFKRHSKYKAPFFTRETFFEALRKVTKPYEEKSTNA